MTTNDLNPYAAPQADSPFAPEGNLDPALLKKVEAIIKDAGQFWLAILMCVFCTGLGAVIIGPWYLVRLLQWHSIAQAQPMLLNPHVPLGSISQKFQSAKWKLITGLSFGAFIFLIVMASLLVLTLFGKPRAA